MRSSIDEATRRLETSKTSMQKIESTDKYWEYLVQIGEEWTVNLNITNIIIVEIVLNFFEKENKNRIMRYLPKVLLKY